MANPSIDMIQTELQATGLPWRIDCGTKHRKIVLQERVVGILPICGNRLRQNDRGLKNVLSQIRRAAREMKPV